jgi:ferric-dicitrate binding protein FerR (iron transport regulator)
MTARPRGKRRFVGSVLAVAVAALAGAAIWTARGATPPFVDADGVLLAGAIAEDRRVTLGDVPQ